MGKAYKAPESRRTLVYDITNHAIERFRERVEEEFRHRSNGDLTRLLDERIDHACRDGLVKVVVDANNLVTFESRAGTPSVAVMRPATRGRDLLSCVTVLTQEMAQQNMVNGTWREKSVNRPFAGLALPAPAPRPAPAAPAAPAPGRGMAQEMAERWPPMGW